MSGINKGFALAAVGAVLGAVGLFAAASPAAQAITTSGEYSLDGGATWSALGSGGVEVPPGESFTLRIDFSTDGTDTTTVGVNFSGVGLDPLVTGNASVHFRPDPTGQDYLYPPTDVTWFRGSIANVGGTIPLSGRGDGSPPAGHGWIDATFTVPEGAPVATDFGTVTFSITGSDGAHTIPVSIRSAPAEAVPAIHPAIGFGSSAVAVVGLIVWLWRRRMRAGALRA